MAPSWAQKAPAVTRGSSFSSSPGTSSKLGSGSGEAEGGAGVFRTVTAGFGGNGSGILE